MAQKFPIRENREFGNFAKTQGILFAQGVNFLILKIQNIAIFAVKFSYSEIGTEYISNWTGKMQGKQREFVNRI